MKQLTADSMAAISGGSPFWTAFCATTLVISIVAPNPLAEGADIACAVSHLF